MVSVKAVGARHGKEWTSRQLIPEGEDVQSSGRGNDCKVYFAEERSSAELPAGATPSETGNQVPEYLRCMFPAEGTLTPREQALVMEALVMEYEDIFVGPDAAPGFTDLITHKIDTEDVMPIKQNYYRCLMKEREYVDAE